MFRVLQLLKNRRMQAQTEKKTIRSDLSAFVGGIELLGQEYDPDLIAIDSGGTRISRERLSSGFGAPPVVAYAQKAASRFPVIAKLLRR